MEITKTPQEIAALIAEALRIPLEETEETYSFVFNGRGVDKVLELPKAALDEVLSKLSEQENLDETVISTPKAMKFWLERNLHFLGWGRDLEMTQFW